MERICAIRRRRSNWVMATAATTPMIGKIAPHSRLGATIAREDTPKDCSTPLWVDATAALWILSKFGVTTVERVVSARGVETQKTASAILIFRAWDIFMGNLMLFKSIGAPMTSLFHLHARISCHC